LFFMKASTGFILLMLGSMVMLYGMGSALYELSMLYQTNITDPLTMGGEEPKVVSARMWRAVIIGLFGIPFFIAGSVMLQVGLFRLFKRKQREQEAQDGREVQHSQEIEAARQNRPIQPPRPSQPSSPAQTPRPSQGTRQPRN